MGTLWGDMYFRVRVETIGGEVNCAAEVKDRAAGAITGTVHTIYVNEPPPPAGSETSAVRWRNNVDSAAARRVVRDSGAPASFDKRSTAATAVSAPILPTVAARNGYHEPTFSTMAGTVTVG